MCYIALVTAQPMLDERRLRKAVSDWSFQSGRRLAVRRRELGWSLQQLAGLVGVTFQMISKYELGLAVPSDAKRWAIACALSVEVDEIWPNPRRAYIDVAAHAESAA